MTNRMWPLATLWLVLACAPGLAGASAPGPVAGVAGRLDELAAHLNARDFDAAAELSEQLLSEPPGSPADEVRLLDLELKRQFRSGDISRLEQVEPRARRAAANPEAPLEARVSLLHDLMTVYTRVPRFDDAVATLDTMLEMLGDEPSPHLLDTLSAKGGVHAMQGQYPQAIEALMRADNVVKALGRPDEPSILRNLAGIFMRLDEHDRAIEYAERGERATRRKGTTAGQRKGMLGMLATTHIAAGHFEQGEYWSKQAIAYGEANGMSVSSEINNYATLLRDNGRHREALALYRQLAADMPADARPELQAVLEKNLGETLVALDRRAEADAHLQRAQDIYATGDFRPNQLELYPVLIENLEALGRPAEALAAMREFKALNDETTDAEAKTRIGELEATLDLARKSQELADAEIANERQRLANEALQAEQARARAVNLALAASLLAAVAVLALLWRTHRLRTRSHRELSARNSEIEEQRSALEALNATIHQQSREDALTRLGNRRHLVEQLAGLDGDTVDLVVMADLDHFKRINDHHGHHVGDRALCHFADALRAVARQQDVLARWGGEEFIWICRGVGADQGPALCERLQRQLREHPLDADGQLLVITASLGFVQVPVWPGGGRPWELALRIADHAVYGSKAAGRDRWTGYQGQGDGHGASGSTPEALENSGQLRRVASPSAAGNRSETRPADTQVMP